MTAPLAVPQHSEPWRGPHLAVDRADTVRAQLLAEAQTHASRLARCAATMTSALEGSTDLDRAMNALRMYQAREALEEIEGALERLDAGRYGICLACDGAIAVERLAAIPQARYCATCSTPTALRTDDTAEPSLDSASGERTDRLPAVRSPRLFGSHVIDRGVGPGRAIVWKRQASCTSSGAVEAPS